MVRAEDAGFEFVEEVLHEEREHYGEENSYMQEHQEEMRRRQEDAERERLAESERMAHEQAERIRQQREESFEREVSQMGEEQAKAARKQKRKDARIVRQILRAANNKNHYAVLGIRNMEMRIAPRAIGIGKVVLRIPAFSLFRVSPKAIRRAYRNRSRIVHPDRNRDGRAEEAFIALEDSAAILSDETLRNEYDEKIRSRRRKRRTDATGAALDVVGGIIRVMGRVVGVLRSVLGPFAFPVLILGLIIA